MTDELWMKPAHVAKINMTCGECEKTIRKGWRYIPCARTTDGDYDSLDICIPCSDESGPPHIMALLWKPSAAILADAIPVPMHLIAQHPDPADPWYMRQKWLGMGEAMLKEAGG